MASYITYDIQLVDSFTGKNLTATGGVFYVTDPSVSAANAGRKATLYNPDSNFAALANPVSMTKGKVRFAVAGAATIGMATIPTMDIYGISGNGIAFQIRGALPGQGEIRLASSRTAQVLMIPFNINDTTATVETDTGFDLTPGMIINPLGCSVYVTAIDATETINVGLLSSESGGDADGILAILSVGTLGVIAPTLASGAETIGALLKVASDSGMVPRQHVVTTAVSVSYTLTAGSDTAGGVIHISYNRPIVPLI
jgi:hypothetical protein